MASQWGPINTLALNKFKDLLPWPQTAFVCRSIHLDNKMANGKAAIALLSDIESFSWPRKPAIYALDLFQNLYHWAREKGVQSYGPNLGLKGTCMASPERLYGTMLSSPYRQPSMGSGGELLPHQASGPLHFVIMLRKQTSHQLFLVPI